MQRSVASKGSPTEGPNGCDHMRPRHPLQRFVAPLGTPSKAPMAVITCVRATQYLSLIHI
eukprot:1277873-Pyramimonas_sp.AAC.1